ncbi:solute carrier family 22 member 4 [Elysia marginata]|uniref:Solute carrier family 22 member 4 n=1 Tax=Elysia marginata TaxID=1093978 RepID=A0AAV4FJD4_9GAST|nr:solute carrier family 22 member 4 [Elysia marginata]
MASLDDVLEDIGVCGPFQGLLVLAIHSTIVLSVWGLMMMAFGSYNPGWFWRGVVASLPTWNIGAALFAVSVIVLKDWRYLHILAAVVSGLVFLPVFWVPESFRWLAVHGRDKDATAVVTKIAKINGRPKPSLKILVNMAECERRRALVEGSHRYSYLDLFQDITCRKTVVIMTFVWISMSVVYFGISFSIQALSGDFYINFVILSVMELPCTLFSLPTITYLPRRWGSALYLFIVAMACFGITIVSLVIDHEISDEDKSSKILIREQVVLTFAVVIKVGAICAWNAMTVFCSELFPTAVRNLGFGYLNSIARIGGYIGPVLFPQDPALLYLAMIVLGIMAFVSSGLLMLLPETKGAPLKDMIHSKGQNNYNVKCTDVVDNRSGGEKEAEKMVKSNGFTESVV